MDPPSPSTACPTARPECVSLASVHGLCLTARPLISPPAFRLKASLSQALAARTDIPAFDTDTPAEKTLKMLDKLMHSEEVRGTMLESTLPVHTPPPHTLCQPR